MTAETADAKRILVVEDEALIALELQTTLLDHGYAVVGPYTRLEKALSAARTCDIHAALLDVRLVNDFIWPVAEVLRARHIPFAYLTGYDSPVPPDRPKAPVFAKPIEVEQVIDGLRALLQAEPP